MCLITFGLNVHPEYRLIVAANRDEFYGRPTESAYFWKDNPSILGGRDLEKMGTWMGVTKQGRFAAVTNYRDPNEVNRDARSRGELVSQFLSSSGPALEYLQAIREVGSDYNGFNLIVSDGQSLYYYSNVNNEIKRLDDGIYGLSNGLLDSSWPKVTESKRRLKNCVEAKEVDPECLFDLLAKTDKAEDNQLPDTGVSLELERLLSSPFIESPNYGTRMSTVVLVTKNCEVTFKERTFGPNDKAASEVMYEFSLE